MAARRPGTRRQATEARTANEDAVASEEEIETIGKNSHQGMMVMCNRRNRTKIK